jgi:hypothetical protein
MWFIVLSVKTAVMTALQSATALSTITGFYFQYPSDFTNLPVISYFEVDNTGSLYADNQEIASGIIYQIDLWGEASLTAYAKAVDTVMTGLDFARVSATDLYEDDTKIYHKAMRFRLDISDPDF